MKTWQALYGMIWLNFFVLLVGTLDAIPFKAHVHGVLGLGVLALAMRNRAVVTKTRAPARLKRIAVAMVMTSTLALLSGILLAIPPLAFLRIVWHVLHMLAIVAVTTQSASLATGFDMWEQRELSDAPSPAEVARAPTAPSGTPASPPR